MQNTSSHRNPVCRLYPITNSIEHFAVDFKTSFNENGDPSLFINDYYDG
jgi:hypothetical protein